MLTLTQAAPATGSLRARPTSTLSQLGDVLTDKARSHHDLVVNSRELTIDAESGALSLTSGPQQASPPMLGEARPRSDFGDRFTLRDNALAQLAAKLRIPASYLRRCPPELLARNINHWLRQDDPRELLLRCDGNEARAVLSTSYQRVDNLRLVSMLADKFGDDTPLRYELTDTQMVIQFVERRDPDVAGRGDLLHTGINVRNSEVGLSSIEIGGLIFRTICANGLILNGRGVAWKRRHIGNSELNDDVAAAIDKAQERSRQATGTFAATTEIIVPNAMEAIDRVAERFQLTEAQRDAVKWGFNIEPGDNLFSLINSVTRGAQNETLGLTARRQLQEVGGRMLALSEKGHAWLG